MKLNCAIWCIFLICCFFSIDSHDIKVKQGQVLCVQRRLDPADESTLTMPDMLSSFGSEFWMKNRAGIIFYNSNIWCLLQKVAWLGGPNVAPSSQQKHKQSVEKNLQRVKKTTFTSGSVTPASPCTTPSGSGRGGHPGHAWQADQPWESILDEKSGTFLLHISIT